MRSDLIIELDQYAASSDMRMNSSRDNRKRTQTALDHAIQPPEGSNVQANACVKQTLCKSDREDKLSSVRCDGGSTDLKAKDKVADFCRLRSPHLLHPPSRPVFHGRLLYKTTKYEKQ